jgi:phage gp46-like protein
MTHTDIAMEKDLQGNYDLVIENGRLKTTESFETAIQMSFFLDARADPSEVPIAENRRGWWGNEFGIVNGRQLGSKLWLLSQARAIQETLLKAIEYTREGFQHFVDDGHATKVEVEGELIKNEETLQGGVKLDIKIFTNQDIVIEKTFTLWLNTKQV